MRGWIGLVGLLLLAGCAFNLIEVKRAPTRFTAAEGCGAPFVLDESLLAQLGGGAQSTLMRQGTRWHCVGTTPQGPVFGSDDQVLTVEASNAFQALPVMQGDRLVGFYLPVEHQYAPMATPRRLKTRTPTP